MAQPSVEYEIQTTNGKNSEGSYGLEWVLTHIFVPGGWEHPASRWSIYYRDY